MDDKEALQLACEIIDRLLDGYGTDQMTMEEWREGHEAAVLFIATHKLYPADTTTA